MTTNPFLPLDPPVRGVLLPGSQAKLLLSSATFHHISLAFLELISIQIKLEKEGSFLKVPSCRSSSQAGRADTATAPAQLIVSVLLISTAPFTIRGSKNFPEWIYRCRQPQLSHSHPASN